MYLLLPVVAGLAITLQGALSSKFSQQIGFLEVVVLIHVFGLITSLVAYVIFGNPSTELIQKISPLVVLMGSLGLVVVFSISKSITINGVLNTTLLSVLVQMICSKVIDHFGWFGVESNPLSTLQVGSILLMITAVVFFQRTNSI